MAYNGNTAKIPLGEYGLLTDIAPDKCPPAALIRATNVCFFNGTVQKAPGAVTWNPTPLPAGIVAAHYWQPTLVEERMIAATSTGNLYIGRDRQFAPASNTTIASTLTPNCVFAEGGAETAGRPKKLFLFTGGASNPYVLSGDQTAFTVLSQPSTDWTSTGTFPKFGVIHRQSLWAFAGQIAYSSDTGDHENFNVTTGLTLPIYPGEGGELRGGYVFKGRLFAYKDGGFVYSLNDQDADNGNWYWTKVASNFGLSAPNAVAEVLNDLYSGNTSGTITSLEATEKLGSVAAADLVQNMQFEAFLRGNTSKVGIPFQHLLYYAEKKILFATYRSAYFTYNDMLLMFDFGRNQAVRAAFWKKGSPQCLASYKDVNQIERPMYGDRSGFLQLMDAEDRTEGTAAYLGEFQSPHWDFSWLGQNMSAANKQFDHLAVHYIPEGAGTLLCDYYIDGRFIDTLTFQMVQYKRPELNTLLLNTDRLAQPNEETCVRPLAGTGRTLSVRFYNSGLNESFQIPAVTVFFRGGGEGAQKV